MNSKRLFLKLSFFIFIPINLMILVEKKIIEKKNKNIIWIVHKDDI